MKHALLLAAAVAVAAPGAGSAVAQDLSLAPTYGSVTLTTGFSNDPYLVPLQSGGSIDASSLGGGCGGYIAEAPDFQVFYTAGDTFPLIISVSSPADTTLVVNDPSGAWYCDDDSGSDLNPSISFGGPLSGRYDIYVGTYGTASLEDATLAISELTSQ